MLAAVRASFAERRLAAVDPAPVYRSGFMKKVSSRKHDRFGRVLDSDPVYLIAALALMALLVSFYAVLLVNMNAIDTKPRISRNIPTRSPLRQVEPKRCSCKCERWTTA